MVSDREAVDLPRPMLKPKKSLSKYYSSKSASFGTNLHALADLIGENATGLAKRRSSVDMHSAVQESCSTAEEPACGPLDVDTEPEVSSSNWWVRKCTAEMCESFLGALRVSTASRLGPQAGGSPPAAHVLQQPHALLQPHRHLSGLGSHSPAHQTRRST